MNLGCLATLVMGLMMLFAGYPIYTHVSLDLSLFVPTLEAEGSLPLSSTPSGNRPLSAGSSECPPLPLSVHSPVLICYLASPPALEASTGPDRSRR